MALFAPHADTNLNLLQDKRNFFLLKFSISNLFGIHGEYLKTIFPSHCSVYWSESDSGERGKAAALAAAGTDTACTSLFSYIYAALERKSRRETFTASGLGRI